MKKRNLLLLTTITSLGLIMGGCNNSESILDTNRDLNTKGIINEDVSMETVENQNEKTDNEINEEAIEESTNEVTTNLTDNTNLSSINDYDFEIIRFCEGN